MYVSKVSLLGLGLVFSAVALGARPQPPATAVLETDPSVTVGAMPPAAPRNQRIEPQRASTPFRAAPARVEAPTQPKTVVMPTRPGPATRVEAAAKPKAVVVPAPIRTSPAPAVAVQKAAPFPSGEGHIARAQLTSLVRNREPVDALDASDVSHAQLYFFTEITGMPGRSVTHRWEYQGQIKHEQKLPIGSARYRTFSKKSLNSRLNGEWKVTVVDDRGTVLTAKTFMYNANDATAETQ